MERSIVPAMNQPHPGQGSNSIATSTQSATNDSLSLHLGNPMMRREPRECNHFVIRQFVVEIRKKDKNMCLPFADQILPPMVVRKNKYRYCKNCLHGFGDVSPLEEIVVNNEIETEVAENGSSDSNMDLAIALSLATSSAFVSLPNRNQLEIILGDTVPRRKRNICSSEEKKQMDANRPSKLSKMVGTSDENTDISKKVIEVSSDSDGEDGGRERSLLGGEGGLPLNKDGMDHCIAGHGVISSISYKDFMGNFNFCSGESSVAHESTASPNIDAVFKNVMDKISRHNAKERERRNLSAMPSNKNFPLVQNSDFPGSHSNGKIGPKRIVKLFGIDLEQARAKGENVRRVLPADGQLRTVVCITNRNPADFSCPDAGNEFMINGQEIKVGKEVVSRGKTVRLKKRAKKDTPLNKRAQDRQT